MSHPGKTAHKPLFLKIDLNEFFNNNVFYLTYLFVLRVDRNKYQIHIPLPPKIDPTVTMMQVGYLYFEYFVI